MAVHLVAHDPAWSIAFLNEAVLLRAALGSTIQSVHHIGSTAVPAVLAKPIIDMLGVASSLKALDAAVGRVCRLGYVAKGEHGIAGRRFFQKMDTAGERSHHFHVFQASSAQVERHLAFRDYLLAHPAIAARYSELKATILRSGPTSRQVYQLLKAPFIAMIEPEAMAWYRQSFKPAATLRTA